MRKKDYAAAMEQTGQHFAYGVSSCKAGGHTLRSKAGHCIQCNHQSIAQSLRHSKAGIVYLAGTSRRKLTKIGVTEEIERRLTQLNAGQYGGAWDWEMLVWATTKEAGRLEYEIQDRLRAYNVPGTYMHDGREQKCYELFSCGYKAARAAFEELLPKGSVIRSKNEDRLLNVYEF
jgi:predicted GIY-YIG superfamily endonuclease